MGFDYMLWGEEKDEGEERRGRKKPQYKGRYLAGPTKTDKLAWKMEALVLLSLCTILVPFWATIFQSESQNIKHDCLLQLQYSLSSIPPKFSGHWPVIILLLLHNKISAVLWLYMHHTYIHVLGSRIRIMDVCITHICIFASCTYPDGQKIYACYVQCIMDIWIKHNASYVHRSGPRVIVMLVIARIIIAPFNVVCSLGGWTDTKEDGCPSGKPFIPPFSHFDHFWKMKINFTKNL